MEVKACRPYHSTTIARRVVRMPDGKSVFKVYYASIINRPERTRYEWQEDTPYAAEFERRLSALPVEGVGFVIAFPHITKIFRFAPAMETVLHVRAFNTPDLSPLELQRADAFLEFACYAEAAIAADEYRLWASSGTVADYLRGFSAFVDGPVATNTKLAEYWRTPGQH